MQKDTGIVNIHGKEYKTVALRVSEFRKDHPEWGIDTNIIHISDIDVIIKATVFDENGRLIGSGIAHEVQGSTKINSTSHVENCETSAIGRALASIGLAGTEYASADELVRALEKQGDPSLQKPWFNDFEKVKEKMIAKLESGESTEKTIIDNLSATFQLSNTVKKQIKDLAAAHKPPH